MYSTLIACCADARQPDLAEKLFNEMRWAGLYIGEHAWSGIIHAHIRGGQLETAFLVLNHMSDHEIEITLPVYTSLLTGIFHLARREECLSKANELWFGMRLAAVEPDLMAYTAMIRCCVRAREMERALNFVNEMRQQGIRPNVVTYNSLIRGASVTPLWHPSQSLVTDEILDLMEQDEVSPNRGTFNALIHSCASVGDVINAKVYFHAMKRMGIQPDVQTYVEMQWALAASQSLGTSRQTSRFLTRPRGWPKLPMLGQPDSKSEHDKVAHLTWDVVKQDEGRKFRGFLPDDSFLIDEVVEEERVEEEEEGHEERASHLESAFSQKSKVASEAMDSSSITGGLDDWQLFLEQALQDARAIVEKGEVKHANRNIYSNQNVESQEIPKQHKSKKKQKNVQAGYKGASTLEEEWAQLVQEVYNGVAGDADVDFGTLSRLEREVEQIQSIKVGDSNRNKKKNACCT
jgi:pentatricopeptide repeat protein